MNNPEGDERLYTCEAEILYSFRALRNGRSQQGIMRITNGEFRGMDFEFSMNQLRIFGFSLSSCDLVQLFHWNLKFTVEVFFKQQTDLTLSVGYVGPRKLTKVKKSALREDTGFFSWLRSKKRTFTEFKLLFPENGHYAPFFPEMMPFTFRECHGTFHGFHDEKKALKIAAQITSDNLNGQIVMFELFDLYIHGYSVRRNVKVIPLIDCSEVINFELRKLSSLEIKERANLTSEVGFLQQAVDLGVHIAYIGQRPLGKKSPGEDDPDLNRWLVNKNYDAKSFFEIISEPMDSKKESSEEKSIQPSNQSNKPNETRPSLSIPDKPQKQTEGDTTTKWSYTIQNPGFETSGAGFSVAKDTANTILDRLMTCVSSNDPTYSTVLSTVDEFNMARFLSKTLVSSMMDFNLRMEKELMAKEATSQSSTNSVSQNLTKKSNNEYPNSKKSSTARKRPISHPDSFQNNTHDVWSKKSRDIERFGKSSGNDIRGRLGQQAPPRNAVRVFDYESADSSFDVNRQLSTARSYEQAPSFNHDAANPFSRVQEYFPPQNDAPLQFRTSANPFSRAQEYVPPPQNGRFGTWE